MSDEKEDIGTDFDEKLAKIVHQKSRKRNNNDIYERFISRVHSSEDSNRKNSKPLEGAQKLPAFEPLSTEELQLFEDQNIDEGSKVNATFDFSNQNVSQTHIPSIEDDDYSSVSDVGSHTADSEYTENSNDTDLPAATAHYSEPTTGIMSNNDSINIEDLVESTSVEEVVTKSKVKSSKKPIVIGIVVGSIVLATIIVMLIFSGILSTSAVDDKGNSADTHVEKDSTPVIDTETITPVESQTVTDDVDLISEQPASIQQSASDNSRPDMPAANELELNPENSTTGDDVAVSETEEAAITYDDFRQESQTTLYRETND